MAVDGHVNFAQSTITVAPSPATSGTACTVADPGVWAAPPFNATVWPSGQTPTVSNAEIVRVTANASGVLTLVRAQESSTARAIVVGDAIAATFTARFVDDLTNASNLASGTIPDARMPSPDLKVTGTSSARVLLTASAAVSGSRNFGITNAGGTDLYLAPYPDDFSAVSNAGLRVDRTGNAKVAADLFEKGRPNAIGHWASIAYSAGNFTAAPSGSWTVDAGDQATYAYMLVGRTVWLNFYLATTSVSGTPTELRVALPSGITCGVVSQQPFSYMDGTTAGTGCIVTVAGEAFIRLRRDSGAVGTWPNATNSALIASIAAIPTS